MSQTPEPSTPPPVRIMTAQKRNIDQVDIGTVPLGASPVLKAARSAADSFPRNLQTAISNPSLSTPASHKESNLNLDKLDSSSGMLKTPSSSMTPNHSASPRSGCAKTRSSKVSVMSLLNDNNPNPISTSSNLSSSTPLPTDPSTPPISTMTPESNKPKLDIIDIDDPSDYNSVSQPASDNEIAGDADSDDSDDFGGYSDEDDDIEFDNTDGDSHDDEEDDDDGDFGESQGYESFYNQDESKKVNIYDVPYSVHTVDEIRTTQIDEAKRVSNIIAVTPEQSETLLRYFKWNGDNLIERYVDHPAKALEGAGIGTDPNNKFVPISLSPYTPQPADDTFQCFICYDTKSSHNETVPKPSTPLITFCMECKHLACLDCYQTYVKGKINDGVSESLGCAQYKCGIKLNKTAVATLFPDEPAIVNKYSDFLLKEYVRAMDRLSFCPAPDCEFIIECPTIKRIDPEKLVPRVKCNCGHAFCFSCNNVDHRPATCSISNAWLKKCRDDSETANWIRANTQECPKCHSIIEKNGGCNHMTCKQCRYEFCWVCLGSWDAHGNQYYNCSRYNEGDAQDARDSQEKSRAELNRYLHYYNRYRNHQQSLALDSETFETMQAKMRELQESKGMSWIEVQFLSQAFDVLRKSRHTLTWTYAFAFYLQKNHECMIFEDNQANLEFSVEQLSELFEKPATDLASLKVQLLDKSKYVANRRIVMLEHAAKGLLNGTWKYQDQLLRVNQPPVD